jgi:hypothetical protein
MSRRSKLIGLWSLNTILAAVIVALVTVVFTSGGNSTPAALACGDPIAPAEDAAFVPTSQSFDTVEEAEAFICHQVAYPHSTPGWTYELISASRSGPAAYVGRGIGFASITLDYMQPNNPAADMRVEISPYQIAPVTYGIVDQVELMGSQANLIQGNQPDYYILQWEAKGFSFYVETHLTDDFRLPDLYDVLNSIR